MGTLLIIIMLLLQKKKGINNNMAKKKLSEEERIQKQKEEKEWISRSWKKICGKQMVHKIHNGDSAKMPFIEDNSVDLVVTSPPYYNAKEYSQWDTIEDYLEDMNKVFKECFEKLKPGRKLCLNISDIPVKGDSGVKWIPLGAYVVSECEKIGYELADRIIWFKTPIMGFQYGSLPFPPSPLICDSMEYIYVLRKPGKSDYKYVNADNKNASKLPREEYAEYTKQIWSIRRVRLKDNIDGHTAPFPYELPYRCIKLYSFVGDTVLDPFGGSGTTSLAAIDLKRNSIISELNRDYCNLIKKNINSKKDLFNNDSVVEV